MPNKSPRLTDRQRRDALTQLFITGDIDADEWARRNAQLDRRYNVLGWVFVGTALLGYAGAAALVAGIVWLFLHLIIAVSGTP